MTPLALASRDETFWWIALGIGAVVLVVVVALLVLLLRLVDDLSAALSDVWLTAKLVARNTINGWKLREAASIVEELRDEVRSHGEVLQRR